MAGLTMTPTMIKVKYSVSYPGGSRNADLLKSLLHVRALTYVSKEFSNLGE